MLIPRPNQSRRYAKSPKLPHQSVSSGSSQSRRLTQRANVRQERRAPCAFSARRTAQCVRRVFRGFPGRKGKSLIRNAAKDEPIDRYDRAYSPTSTQSRVRATNGLSGRLEPRARTVAKRGAGRTRGGTRTVPGPWQCARHHTARGEVSRRTDPPRNNGTAAIGRAPEAVTTSRTSGSR